MDYKFPILMESASFCNLFGEDICIGCGIMGQRAMCVSRYTFWNFWNDS